MLVRTKTLGTYKLEENFFGSCLVKAIEPEGVDDNVINSFELNEQLPLITSDIWNAVIKLYFKFAKLKNGQEVSVIFLLDSDKVVHCFVPKQEVTGASVRASYKELCNIITGEHFKYPEDLSDYVFYGTSHSHAQMQFDTFSSTDDHYESSNLGFHILVSSINLTKNTYKVLGSLCYKKKRYLLDLEQTKNIIDFNNNNSTYHKNVLNYITEPKITFNTKVPVKISNLYDLTYDRFTIQNDIEQLLLMSNLTKEQLIELIREL